MLLARHRRVTEVEEAETLTRPTVSASKGDWVAYATQEGHDVEGLKKDDIIALLPEKEADETPGGETPPPGDGETPPGDEETPPPGDETPEEK